MRMQDLAQWHVLGEYCGVVKTGAQLELDAIAACASDERVTGYIIKDKVEAFDTDVALPGVHSLGLHHLVISGLGKTVRST